MNKPKIFEKGKTSINSINLNSIKGNKSKKELENENHMLKILLSSFLEGSGYADIGFLIDELVNIEKLSFTSKIENVIDESVDRVKESESLEFNDLIYYLYEYVVNGINKKYHIQLEIGNHIEIYPNALASSLALIKDLEKSFPDLSKENIREIKEIIEKIG